MGNKRFIRSILDDLRTTSRFLTEDYIFGDENDDMESGSAPLGRNGDKFRYDGDEASTRAQYIVRREPIILKIRETAIDGLKKYAEDPTSPIYGFFKKIFLESDKLLSDDASLGAK